MSELKEKIMTGFQWVGINHLCKYLTRNRPRIIMFHKIYPDGETDKYSEYTRVSQLDKIVAYSAKNYTLFNLKDLVYYRKQHGYYPNNALVLTFDDGFKSVMDYALPVLKKYQAPATLFVCPQLIDDDTTIWSELLFDAYENKALGNTSYQELIALVTKMKTLDNGQRKVELQKVIASAYQYIPTKASVNRQLLSWDNLKTLQASGLIEIGSHSMTHPILANESEAQVMHEVKASKQRIEEMLGQTLASFCYPNGQEDDYKKSDVEALSKSGYLCAVTASFGFPSASTNEYLLPRFGGDFVSFLQARKYIDGVEFIQRRLLDRT